MLFTKDLGVLYAKAQGIRRKESKLKFALVDFAFSKVSLVRGKEVWRIVNAIPIENTYYMLRDKPEHGRIAARMMSLITRLVSGEDPDPELFILVHDIVFALGRDISEQHLPAFEALAMLHVLAALGYAVPDTTLQSFTHISFRDDAALFETLKKAAPHVSQMITAINIALKASQL